jgi:hypothetical protein
MQKLLTGWLKIRHTNSAAEDGMKIRTAMKSKVEICGIQSDGCIATKTPLPIEAIYAGPQDQEICVCSVCLKKKLMTGDWAMWYWDSPVAVIDSDRHPV